jgi:hypothetical protein
MKILVQNKLIMLVGLLFLSALFSTSAIAEDYSDQSVNELSFGITVSANGSLTSASVCICTKSKHYKKKCFW